MELHGRHLRAGAEGYDVGQLHDELTVLGYGIAQAEHARKAFGDTTAEAVRVFQRQHGLPVTAVVDEQTASALTRALEQFHTSAHGTSTVYVGSGTTPPVTTPPAASPPASPPATSSAATGRATVVPPPGGQPATTPSVTTPSATTPSGAAPATGGRVPGAAGTGAAGDRSVEGFLYTESGQAAPEVRIRLYHKGFRCAESRLAEGTSGREGQFLLLYQMSGPANLEVRAADANGTEVSLMHTLFNAPVQTKLNLIVPGSVARTVPEHARLLSDLREHLGPNDRLGEASQHDDCDDITLLSRNSGWDGRLVTLAVRADQLSVETGVDGHALYALLRTGLPADTAQLARLDPDLLDQAFRKATRAGVAQLSDADIAAAREALSAHARRQRRDTICAPGTLSTVGGMLDASGLSTNEQEVFDSLAAAHHDDPARLWQVAREAGLPGTKIDALKLQGKLACLTLNNAPLIAALGVQSDLPSALLDQDLHTEEAWGRVINQAGGARVVPPAFTGENRVADYAEDLARKVRIALPTQVVARRVAKGELDVPGAPQQFAQVLMKAADQFGFRFGSTPAARFLNEHGDALFAGMSRSDAQAAGQAMSTLQRVYQMTPDDQSMKVLVDNGMTSAYLITADERFVEKYATQVGGAEKAAQIVRKAQQVSAVVYNAFAAISQAASNPTVYAVSAGSEQSEESKNNLIKHYPTLEELFGSLDFCECEHCRSVLSPAAYLVDLLRFLDPDPAIWKGGGPTPYEKLIQRRPDIPELPLTCENTNVALPYIDIVNEIMEFSVAGQALSARDVGQARTEDLLAEPQYVIPQAYQNLLGDLYYPLPFDLWLETVRGFLGALGVPLADLLEALRPTDDLDPTFPQKYGRRSVLLERLGLTPVEAALHTDVSDADWYKLYGYADTTTALTELRWAKTLARKLDISYVELAETIHTQFVSPQATSLATLRKLGLDVEDVRRYLGGLMPAPDHDAVADRLGGAGVDDTWLTNLWNTDLQQALTLTDTKPGCGFDDTVVRRAGGDENSVTALDLKRINLLVRLRKKLGWKLSELDTALSALMPSGAGSLGEAMAEVLVHLSRLDSLSEEVKAGKDARTKLLALWGDMPVSLYEQLFLTPSVKAQDEAFDHPLAQYLSAAGVALADHQTAVQGAFGLTTDEIKLILADNGSTLEAAPLDFATVSLLYRYRIMANGLKLKVADIIALRGLSGQDPFLPKGTAATVGFAELARLVKASGLKLDELDYLLRERSDPTGPLHPRPEVLLVLVRTLASGMARINAAYPDPAEPFAYTDEQLAQQLPLALPGDVATMFLGMWSGTALFSASVPAMTALTNADYAGEQALSLSYDSVRNLQWLSYRGVLIDSEYHRLKSAHPDATFVALLDLIKPQAAVFFESHLTGVVGPFAPTDFPVLFDPPANEAGQRARRAKLAQGFLPYLRAKLVDAFIIDTASATHEPGGRDFVASLLLDQTLAQDPSAVAPLMAAYRAVSRPGLTVTYYASADGSGAPLGPPATVSDVDTIAKPGGAGSAIFEGYLEVPATGAYAFAATLAPGTSARMRFGHLADPLLSGSAVDAFTELRTGTAYQMTVLAGGLSAGNDVTLNVRADALAPGSLSRLTCHSASNVERLRRADSLLGKVLRLCAALELTEPVLRELDWFHLNDIPTLPVADSASVGLFGQFTRLAEFSRLRADIGVTSDELIDIFRYAKRTYPTTADFNAAKDEVLADVCRRLGELTRRPAAVVAAAANELAITADADTTTGVVTVAGLRSEAILRRLWTVLSQAQTLGATPDALGRWATPAPDQAVAVDLRSTLKARYEPDAWRRVAKPVSDALRRVRRDALVAYLLQHNNFQTRDELYEYFLVDPGTEPVVQTSRLRQAISSVQLFVQRCLLNMESPGVLPGSINASQWEWMKRYRIWEANRKIFLWPENWLEPEWRDDKTHLFAELEGTLLQGEITPDLAEDALFSYLNGLEEIARLEIMSTWLEEDPADPAYNALHVLARTHHEPRKYFYRVYKHLQWTPWQPVGADIEGDHVVLAVWRQRPCIFWLAFLERAITPASTSVSIPADGSTADVATKPVKKDIDISLNWCERVQGEWKAGNSSAFGKPLTFRDHGDGFDRSKKFIHAAVFPNEDSEVVRILLTDGGDKHQPASPQNWVELAVVFHNETAQPSVGGGISVIIDVTITNGFEIAGRNSPARTVGGSRPVSPPFTWTSVDASHYNGPGPLHVWYTSKIDGSKETKTDTDVLGKGSAFSLVIPPSNVTIAAGKTPEIGSLIRPFFYQNDAHTFYVEPSLTEKTFADWDGWIIDKPAASTRPNFDSDIKVVDTKPIGPPPEEINPLARYAIQQVSADSILGQGIAVQYGQKLITG